MLYEVITLFRRSAGGGLSILGLNGDSLYVAMGIVITSYSIHYTKLYEAAHPGEALHTPGRNLEGEVALDILGAPRGDEGDCRNNFV